MQTQAFAANINLFYAQLFRNQFKSKIMERKIVEKTIVLKHTLASTLNSLAGDIGEIPNQLAAKAGELGLEIVAPQIWQYIGSDGNPHTRFTLDICLPVNEAKTDAGVFEFSELPAFNCITELHLGAWMNLGQTYHKILGEMTRKAMVPTGVTREVYLQCDFQNPENCVTEIQIEVK
jgi:effector-binding domain-containing protein